MVIPDRWIPQGSLNDVYKDAGLDSDSILKELEKFGS